MKIQLISDTHGYLNHFMPHPDANLIIHAGDFTIHHDKACQQIRQFIARCEHYHKPYVLVLGNHDYYGHQLDLTLARSLKAQGINVLYRGEVFEFEGMRFIGDTLWTDFDLYGQPSDKDWWLYYQRIADFAYILNISHEQMIDEHIKTIEFFNQYRHQKDVFVVSHFPPCEQMLDKKFADSPLNPYFINNVSVKGFTHWACGHTHHTTRQVVDGCQLYLNASGYQSGTYMECLGFDENYLIEC